MGSRPPPRARESSKRLRRGQAMVEYSFLNWWLLLGLALTLSSNVFPGKKNVIDLFLEEESGSVAMLSDFIGKPVSMQVESSYTQEQFDIVLM